MAPPGPRSPSTWLSEITPDHEACTENLNAGKREERGVPVAVPDPVRRLVNGPGSPQTNPQRATATEEAAEDNKEGVPLAHAGSDQELASAYIIKWTSARMWEAACKSAGLIVHDATPTHDARGRTQKYGKHVQILMQQHVIDGAQSRVWRSILENSKIKQDDNSHQQ